MLSPQGTEIDRICGFDGNKEKYFQIIQDYAAGKNTLIDFLSKYEKDSSNIELNFKLVKKYINRWENPKAQKYINNVLTLDPENNYGFREESELHKAIYEARYKEVTDKQPLITFLQNSNNEEFLNIGYRQLIRAYRIEKDTTKYFEALDAALIKLPKNTSLMNEYAWTVFKIQAKDKYKRAIELAEKAVELEPEAAGIWDTLAWLYLVDGENEKAISAMKEAVNINSDYEERLKKLKTAISENNFNFEDI